ncbi:MAG: glycosyltransferase [Bacteroidales bacterium]|nr:glycosyltransferase [Candidatus Physcousia equi]
MILSLLIAFATGAVLSLFMLMSILSVCRKYGIVDNPNWRKLHKVAVPRMGGLIFVPSLAASVAVGMGFMEWRGVLDFEFGISTYALVAGTITLYLVGLSDDIREMKAGTKFVVQSVVSLLFPLCNLMISNLQGFCGIHELPLWLSYLFTVFVIMFIVNAINLIDGIDGLASGLSIGIMMVLAVLYSERGMYLYTLMCVCMIATLVVFFLFNVFGKEGGKKIFMGDAGSLTLGYIIAYLVIKYQMPNLTTGAYHADNGILISYSLVLIPTFDVVRVALNRKMHGRPMFSPDKTHLHHKLIRSGHYMRMTLLIILSAAVLYLVFNLLAYDLGMPITLIVLLDIALFLAWNLWIDRAIRINEARLSNDADLHRRFVENARKAKKICILTPRFPLPENGGDVLRINNIARQLRAQGYELVLVSFEEDGAPQVYEAQHIYNKVYTVHRGRVTSAINSLLSLLRAQPIQCGYYASSAFSRKLSEVIEKERPDLYIAHLLRMMPYLDALGVHDRSVIEMTDALSKTYSMSNNGKGNGLLRFLYNIERKLILRAEQYALMHFPKNVLVSAADIEYLRTQSEHPGSMVLHTNGIDCVEAPTPHYDPNKIVFVGNMRTLQNQDAALRFIEGIFPKILKKQPDARFYIVGAQPPRSLQQLASNRIIITGFVDDLEATICDACLVVAPVHVAAGIQNKVLVAMATGLPVVLTPLIAGAIPELEHETNCMIQEEDSAFAEDCLRIMRHPELRKQLAEKGYEMVQKNYSWKEKISGYVG